MIRLLILVAFSAAMGALAGFTQAHASETCNASWYGKQFQGNRMASGERFNMHDPSIAAHRSLPFGTRVRITNLKNGKSIRAVMKDRGPFVHGRCLDLSRAGAAQLGYLGTGTTTVSVQIIR